MYPLHVQNVMPELIAQQLLETTFLPPQFGADSMASIQDPNLLISSLETQTPTNTIMVPMYPSYEPLIPTRSASQSKSSAQSLSPIVPLTISLDDDTSQAAILDPFTNSLKQVKSTNIAPSARRDSDDDGERAERRRAQNRAAQRAYRQRKDASLKQREREIETLRQELDKARQLNKTLCKVVALLRARMKASAQTSNNT